MALFLANGNGGGNGGATILHSTTRHHQHHLSNPPQLLLPLPPRRPPLYIVSATNNKKLSSSSRTGKFDSKNRRNSPAIATTTTADQEDQQERQPVVEGGGFNSIARDGGKVVMDDGFVLPKLPGEEPDFWEGPQWDTLGFFVQYLWAFGVVFALIACGIAVVTYNEGATDFKDTPVYKESVQSRELLEEPEGSNADVFESNPTEVAPSVE